MSLTRPDIIYVFFGKEAQSFIPYLSDFLYNPIVLKENHPSYYARTGIPMEYTIFKEIDNKLSSRHAKRRGFLLA